MAFARPKELKDRLLTVLGPFLGNYTLANSSGAVPALSVGERQDDVSGVAGLEAVLSPIPEYQGEAEYGGAHVVRRWRVHLLDRGGAELKLSEAYEALIRAWPDGVTAPPLQSSEYAPAQAVFYILEHVSLGPLGRAGR